MRSHTLTGASKCLADSGRHAGVSQGITRGGCCTRCGDHFSTGNRCLVTLCPCCLSDPSAQGAQNPSTCSSLQGPPKKRFTTKPACKSAICFQAAAFLVSPDKTVNRRSAERLGAPYLGSVCQHRNHKITPPDQPSVLDVLDNQTVRQELTTFNGKVPGVALIGKRPGHMTSGGYSQLLIDA